MKRFPLFWILVIMLSVFGIDIAINIWIELFKSGEISVHIMQKLKRTAPLTLASIMCLMAVEWKNKSKSTLYDLIFAFVLAMQMLLLQILGLFYFSATSRSSRSVLLLLIIMFLLSRKQYVQDKYFAIGIFLFLIGPMLLFI